ncbi:hypothetical protein N9P60_00110 [bacterium]|nr:hypothetical protein [bacterium]MDB4319831.1 hypothetical protein [bacterium]
MKRYSSIRETINTNENLRTLGLGYKVTNKYPEIPLSSNDIQVITNFGDRLDLMANQFYNDSTLYWVIAAANPDEVNFGSLFLTEGSQIRIPTDLNEILRSYKFLNEL